MRIVKNSFPRGWSTRADETMTEHFSRNFTSEISSLKCTFCVRSSIVPAGALFLSSRHKTEKNFCRASCCAPALTCCHDLPFARLAMASSEQGLHRPQPPTNQLAAFRTLVEHAVVAGTLGRDARDAELSGRAAEQARERGGSTYRVHSSRAAQTCHSTIAHASTLTRLLPL